MVICGMDSSSSIAGNTHPNEPRREATNRKTMAENNNKNSIIFTLNRGFWPRIATQRTHLRSGIGVSDMAIVGSSAIRIWFLEERAGFENVWKRTMWRSPKETTTPFGPRFWRIGLATFSRSFPGVIDILLEVYVNRQRRVHMGVGWPGGSQTRLTYRTIFA